MACLVQHPVERFQPGAFFVDDATVLGMQQCFQKTKGESFGEFSHDRYPARPIHIPLQPQFPSPFTGR